MSGKLFETGKELLLNAIKIDLMENSVNNPLELEDYLFDYASIITITNFIFDLSRNHDKII